VLEQVRQRFANEKIKDRLVSLFDADARLIRKDKLSAPTQFGSVVQVTELTVNTKRGARGLLLPPTTQVGNRSENELLPETVAQLELIDAASHLKVAAVEAASHSRPPSRPWPRPVLRSSSWAARRTRARADISAGWPVIGWALREGSPTSSANTVSIA
jgi:hypothetical protein